VLKLRTVSCEIDCGQYTRRSTCEDYGYYCRWNSEDRTCDVRR
jgi:hypothetical protein